jgi:putative endopeptidase
VGAILGHEISHALDDLGRRLDPFGRLRDWWTPADQFAIRQRAHALAGQFAAHLSIDDVPVDAMTLDENLADLGGVAVAYQAYQRRAGSDASVLDGFTGSQRFFIAWARIWRTRERNPYERQAQLLRPHTPDEFRVNGTLSNLDAFVEAFDVREGDRLYRAPDDRVRIW